MKNENKKLSKNRKRRIERKIRMGDKLKSSIIKIHRKRKRKIKKIKKLKNYKLNLSKLNTLVFPLN